MEGEGCELRESGESGMVLERAEVVDLYLPFAIASSTPLSVFGALDVENCGDLVLVKRGNYLKASQINDLDL